MSFSSSAAGFTSPTPSWQSYLDLELDGKPYLQYPKDKDDQDNVMRLLLETACYWVQDYLARPVAPTEFQHRFDGWTSWQGAYIVLPYAPILQVVSVIEWWGTSGPHTLVEQTPAEQYGVGKAAGAPANTYQVDPILGKIIRTFPGLIQKPFFPGSRNIEIKWVAGYSPVPPSVKFATLELFAHLYRNTQEDPRMAASIHPYGDDADRNTLWPAVPNRVTVMLEPYVQQGIG